MSVKPIFVVGIPCFVQSVIENLQKKLESLFVDDYYCIVYGTDKTEPQFQAFFEKDFNEIKFEELKQIVKDSMENGNDNS